MTDKHLLRDNSHIVRVFLVTLEKEGLKNMATALVTATATHGIGQLFEIAQKLQNAELDYNETNALTPNFTPVNNIAVTYDTEALTATVTATLPIAISQTASGATIVALDYM